MLIKNFGFARIKYIQGLNGRKKDTRNRRLRVNSRVSLCIRGHIQPILSVFVKYIRRSILVYVGSRIEE